MIDEKARNRLLVEGTNDMYTVIHLMEHHDVDWSGQDEQVPFVNNCGGLSTLLNVITAAVKSYEKLGILVDADINPANRWLEVTRQLKFVDIELPAVPSPEGLVIESVDLNARVGIWLMPDNSDPGTLEDFIATLVPDADACWPYSAEVVEEARKQEAPFRETDRCKAQIHTWLAWQDPPGLPFGTAIKSACFKHDSEVALRFVAWFKHLFLE